MKVYIDIALIITSVALIASVILQSKGAGLGGLTGMDTGEDSVSHHGHPELLVLPFSYPIGDVLSIRGLPVYFSRSFLQSISGRLTVWLLSAPFVYHL